MTKSKTKLFIAKSLTISSNFKNYKEIKEILKLQDIDWELFVKISTDQLIMPALYCNYKRKKLLKYLPIDLVTYMQKITSLNRKRNLEIIEQIKNVNRILRKNSINPIFLKGASNLMLGLYEDIAERMVGDIDLLVSKDEFEYSVKILLENNYHKVSKIGYDFPTFRHYPRLFSDDEIAAVEIHKEMVIQKYAHEFNYGFIKNDVIHKKGFSFLSFDHQKALSIFSDQINDYGYNYNTVNLKNAYDFLIISRDHPQIDFAFSLNKLRTPIMCYIASINYLFGNNGLNYENSVRVNLFLKRFKFLLRNPLVYKVHSKIISLQLFFSDRSKIILRSFQNTEYRDWLIKRLLDKKWQREKLVQLKIKKPENQD